ncbi:hypothetical protein [Ralstonia pseudosolanacearum]|uniref:hypothetical protein n=1 Tax=Ralstonia pseudosolanacearum TaxID=1310165 RepID=UPI001FFA2705|nr:hypothetical protein [Ralstonia pseudosolanacearum]
MPFLAISCFLMYANLIAALRYVRRGGTYAAIFGAGHMLACTTAAFGFLVGTELLVLDRDGGIAGDAYNWTPVAYLVFGVLSVILFALKLYEKVRENGPDRSLGIVFGVTLWAALASLYICFTTVDHFTFFRDRAQTGQMDVAFSGEQLNCSGGTILVRIEGDTAHYRCPNSIRLGRDYQDPFVPWPSYTEGSSTQLKARVDAVMEQVSKTNGMATVPSGEIKIYPNSGRTAE